MLSLSRIPSNFHKVGLYSQANVGLTKPDPSIRPAIAKPGEMAAILNNLAEGDILFVDEIHRLNRQVEEVLYPSIT